MFYTTFYAQSLRSLLSLQIKMSQIRVSSLTNLRGRAYKCLHCRGNNPCIGEKRRVEAHVYKTHVPLESSPFYCKLCMFRCTAQDDLERHVQNFNPHRERAAQQGDDFNVEGCLMKSANPYYVTSADMVCLSIEESEKIWQKRKKSTSKLDLPPRTATAPAPLNSPPPIQRQIGTPVQDENIWDTIMGPSQYSSNMTLTPPSIGLHTPPSTITDPNQIPVQPVVPTTVPSSVLPGHSVYTSEPSALVQHPFEATSSVSLPAISTLISSSVTSTPTPRTTHTVVAAATPVLTSTYSPVSPFISTCAELSYPTATLTPSATLPTTLPLIPTSTSLSQQASASRPGYLLPRAAISIPHQPVPVDLLSSPYLTYNPQYPAMDPSSYIPTPIVTATATKPIVRSAAQQTDSSEFSSTVSSADLVAAVNDLNKTLHQSMSTISKALENHNLILGAINLQIKNYVRMGEESRKRRYEDEHNEKEKYKEPKNKKHRK